MDQFKRDQILDEINGSKLTAEVAVVARNDELVEHVSNIIHGVDHDKKIAVSSSSNSIKVQIPRVQLELERDQYSSYPFYVYVEFDYHDEDGKIQPHLNLDNLSYKTFVQGCNACLMLKAAAALSDKLDEIKNHVNSDMFKAYKDDINAYLEAEKSLNQFDANAREEKIKQVAESFKNDMCLRDYNGITHLIKKATRKRVWMTNCHYYNGTPKQSEDKMLIAEYVVDSKWSIVI